MPLSLGGEDCVLLACAIRGVLGHSGDLGGAAAVTWRHYAQHDFMPEKRRALEAWEGLLLQIVGERKRPPNVTDLEEERVRRA